MTNLQDRISEAEGKASLIRMELSRMPRASQLSSEQRAQRSELQAQLASSEAATATYKASLAVLQQSQAEAGFKYIERGFADQVAAKVAGTTVPPPVRVPKEVMAMSIFFTMFVLGPLAIAFAIRLVRRGGSAKPDPQLTDMSDRVRRIEAAVETMAIEVERVSESQRFLVRTLSDEAKLPAPKG